MDETERLRKHTQAHQEQLRKERDRVKTSVNERMDDDLPDFLNSYPFWCDECQEDKTTKCHKIKFKFGNHWISVMAAECPDCGARMLRYATHRDEDKYYQKSLRIRRDRNRNYIDMLQQDEWGFKTKYGDREKEKMEKTHADVERSIYEREWRTGLKGKSMETKTDLKRFHKEWR